MFRDITPLLGDAEGFRQTIAALIDAAPSRTVSKVVGVEARGFISGGSSCRRTWRWFCACA